MPMKPVEHFTVLTPQEFIKDVAEEAKNARNRVWAQAMEVEPGKISDTFFAIFKDSAKNGLDTRFHADYFSLMVTDGHFHYLPLLSKRLRVNKKKKIRAKQHLANEFKEAGVNLLYTNPPTILDRIFPVRGRNHMKIVVVDNLAWIGGVNFSEENFTASDVMVKITDESIVSEIAYVFEQIDRQEQLRDMAIDCTPDTKLLIDGGQINRSLILRHTIQLVRQAKTSLVIISPLIPDADLLAAVKRAMKRGVTVDIIAPQSAKMSGIFVLLDEYNGFMMRLKGGNLPIHFKNRMIHAKILIADGQEAIVGSHNLSSRGVRMGTEEIALRSTDKTLVQNLTAFYETLRSL